MTQKIKFEGSDMCWTGGRPFSVTLGASRGLDSWRKPWSSRGYVNRGSATKVRLGADLLILANREAYAGDYL